MNSVTTTAAAVVAEDDEMADIKANDTNQSPNPVDPTTATITTTTATITTTSDSSNKNDTKTVPAATASMCYYCFDVLFYEMYQQQQQQAASHVSFPFSKSFRSNSHTTTTDSQTVASTSVVPLSKPIICPIIDQFVQNNTNTGSASADPPPHTTVHRSNYNDDPPTTTPSTVIECPLFVTWEKRKSKKTNSHTTRDPSATAVTDEYELRGCIGSLAPKRIDHDHLNHYIRASAFHDTRFTPISYQPHNNNSWREISSLRVSISLLVQYETCRDCYDWVIGQHGIIIKFSTPLSSSSATLSSSSSARTTSYSATFLPEVAPQQSWDHATTLRQLIHKAGYTGSISSSLLQSIHCTRYQSSKYTMTFRQYVELYHLRQQYNCNSNNNNPYSDSNAILMDIIAGMNDLNANGIGHYPQPPSTNTPPDQTPPHNCLIM